MTGREIRAIRLAFGLDPARFAQLLGVHASSVYRWEDKGDHDAGVDPLQLQILNAMHRQIAARSAPARRDLAHGLVASLVAGGALLGLYKLLEAVLDLDDVPSRSRRSRGAVARTTRGRAKRSSKKR